MTMARRLKRKIPALKSYQYKLFLTLLLILSFLWFFRPWFHDWLIVLYKNPALIQAFIIWLLLSKIFIFKEKSDLAESVKICFSVFLLVLLLSFTGFVSTYLPKLYLAKTLEYNKISSLPETKKNIRLMPFEVAFRFAKDSLQLSQYKLGRGNIAVLGENKTLSWVFPLIPDGFVLQLLLKNKGIVYVDATTQSKNTKMVWKELEIGDGMQIFDNLFWNIYKKKYWIEADSVYYIPSNNEIYTVIPVIGYELHVYYGFLYAVPKFEGVFLIDSIGNIEFLSPKEALENEILKDNWIFPEKLARIYVEAYAFKKGLINYFFIHEDQIDIQDVYGRGVINRQPFLMDTEQGLKWFVSTEPHGESHGIFKIFLVDARTGKIEIFELPENETLTGHIKARDFVRRANPLVDWNRFIMVEPLPFITNSTLYWKIVVIPRDAAGIAYQAFVNAKTNEVIELKKEDEIKRFIETGKIEKEEILEKTSKEKIIEEIKKRLNEIEELLKKLA